MISAAVLEGVARDHLNGPAIISRVLAGGALSDIVDSVNVVEYIVNLSTSKDISCRVKGFSLFQTLLKSSLFHNHSEDGRVLAFIDRLPGIMEAISSVEECDHICFVIHAMNTNGTEAIIVRYESLLSRILTATIRIIRKSTTCLSGLSILSTIITSSRNAALVSPHTPTIRRTCISLIDHPTAYDMATKVLALCFSIESADGWTAAWTAHSVEGGKVVEELGIDVQGLQTHALYPTPSILANNYKHSHGLEKAIGLERMFRGCCGVLQQMLLCGCVSGAVSLDLSPVLSMLSAVLSLQVDASLSDPKSIIQNDHGLSAVDLSVILAELKIHSISLLRTLLLTPRPALLKSSVSICRIVNILMNCRETHTLSSVSGLAVQVMALAVKCFPTVATQTGGKSGISVLVDMFLRETSLLVRSQSGVAANTLISVTGKGVASDSNGMGTSSLDNSGSAGGTPAGAEAVMDAIEELLLVGSALLEEQLRVCVEVGTGQLLLCLCKGVMLPMAVDRRLKRYRCELIRCQPHLQSKVLQLATTELQTSHRNGAIGGNLPYLRRAAEACLGQAETISVARRALLAIETLIHPVAAVLPPMPMQILVDGRLKQRSEASFSTTGSGVELVVGSESRVSAEEYTDRSSTSGVKRNQDVVTFESHANGKKRKTKETEEKQSNSSEGDQSEEVAAVTEVFEPPEPCTKQTFRFGSVESVLSTSKTSRTGDNDAADESDELPDIDIAAEPDTF